MKVLLLILCIPINLFSQKYSKHPTDSLQFILATTLKAPTLQRAESLNRLGKLYLNSSDYIHSMECFSECLDLALKYHDEDLQAASYRNMAVVYFYQENYDTSLIYDQRALSLFDKKKNLGEKALVLKAMGDIFLEREDSLKAARNYDQALVLFGQAGDEKGVASVYANQAILCGANYERKIELGLKAKKIWDSQDPGNVLPAINTGNIGVAYLDIVRYDSLHRTKASPLIPADRKQLLRIAEGYLKEAIAMSHQSADVEDSSYFTGVLAELQAQKGDYKDAYLNFRKYQDITDSIFSQENKNKIADLESRKALELKNTVIEAEQLQLNNQRKNMWLLVTFTGFLIIVGGLLYWQNRTRKKTNILLLRLNGELDEANKLKAKFFGILSHDLRSPIANLVNFLQLTKSKPGSMTEEQRTSRENKISQSANSLLEIMEAMLLWSKRQMEHFKPEIASVPVKDLFGYLRKYYTDHDRIKFTFSGDESLVALTDGHFLQTIMQNLTSNAIRALEQTPDSSIEWKAARKDDHLLLTITDNGPGISSEKLKSLYDETVISSARHGLGMHIIRDLAKAIGCVITASTLPGSGSEFVLSVPTAQASA